MSGYFPISDWQTRFSQFVSQENLRWAYDGCTQKVALITTWVKLRYEEITSYNYMNITTDLSESLKSLSLRVQSFSFVEFQRSSKQFIDNTIDCIKSKTPINLIFGPARLDHQMSEQKAALRLEKEALWQEELVKKFDLRVLRLENPILSEAVSERLLVEITDRQEQTPETLLSIYWEIAQEDGSIEPHTFKILIVPEKMASERSIAIGSSPLDRSVEAMLEPIAGVRKASDGNNIVQETYHPIDFLKFSSVGNNKLRFNLNPSKPAVYKLHVLDAQYHFVTTYIELPASLKEELERYLSEHHTVQELMDFIAGKIGVDLSGCLKDFQIVKPKEAKA